MYLIVVILSGVLVLIVSILFFTVSYKKLMDTETFSSYECGFSLISMTRMFFSFRFFLIAVLFLIFDVEIVLLLPIPFLSMNSNALLATFVFFMILVVGLMYEYYYGSLNWLNFISKA